MLVLLKVVVVLVVLVAVFVVVIGFVKSNTVPCSNGDTGRTVSNDRRCCVDVVLFAPLISLEFAFAVHEDDNKRTNDASMHSIRSSYHNIILIISSFDMLSFILCLFSSDNVARKGIILGCIVTHESFMTT